MSREAPRGAIAKGAAECIDSRGDNDASKAKDYIQRCRSRYR
ncbi:MAG: putative rhamnosyl transferase [Candidatus Omnitrophica bacterium]|nr:putative rhamnosyl transferase [Candidatus Omnitrophota bacterium]MBU1128955.1 putative rhamnosyl transferase [Candidatus Omnitrophota bacterium]MBU1784100.1 putative rhamnosyl transferase [Candidatus Omnitrophota bacterium]MBU1850830.1 putative rhamnosyl transferase [Candidatus Omnitrophota bacterium]